MAACAIIIFTNIEDIEDWWERKLSGFATKISKINAQTSKSLMGLKYLYMYNTTNVHHLIPLIPISQVL